MSIKLFNGLINLGGILTETYYRKTRATPEAQLELGLDPRKSYNASIGIASVDEYVVLTKTNLNNAVVVSQDLTPFNQPLQIVAVHSSNMNLDRFTMTVLNDAGTALYKYAVNRNLAFYPISNIVIPMGGKIDLIANDTIGSITIVLKPCMIIADSIPASLS